MVLGYPGLGQNLGGLCLSCVDGSPGKWFLCRVENNKGDRRGGDIIT